jgi:pyruvate formate lyase activating enzyme
MEKAKWLLKEDETHVRCQLCPHECRIASWKKGICGIRKNSNGQLYSLNYGSVCVTTVDSIEKKPIFHHRPGSKLFSIGTVGCNLDCAGCQNSELARGGGKRIPFTRMSPSKLVSDAISKGVDDIGWTFNEPVVWVEYVIDASAEARKNSLYSMMNTNGFITKGARDDLLPHTDVLKIDVKEIGRRNWPAYFSFLV